MFIEFDKVSFQYNSSSQDIIQQLNLELTAADFTALVGPNGSGKTTIGKLAAGIIKPDQGNVLIQGQSADKMSLAEIGNKIGYLFQNPERQLFSSTVAEELSFVMEINDREHDFIDQKVDEMLELFALTNHRNSFPFELSQGEKQRLALAAIFINNPAYLILDEPTTGLDRKRKREFSALLETFKQRGTGMLLISHDHQFVTKHARRIIRIEEGRIVNDQIN